MLTSLGKKIAEGIGLSLQNRGQHPDDKLYNVFCLMFAMVLALFVMTIIALVGMVAEHWTFFEGILLRFYKLDYHRIWRFCTHASQLRSPQKGTFFPHHIVVHLILFLVVFVRIGGKFKRLALDKKNYGRQSYLWLSVDLQQRDGRRGRSRGRTVKPTNSTKRIM